MCATAWLQNVSSQNLVQFVISFFITIIARQCSMLAVNIFYTLLSSSLFSINARHCKTYPVKVSYNPLSASLSLKCTPMQHTALGNWDWCHGGIDVFRWTPTSVVNSSYISMSGKRKNRSKPLKMSLSTLLTRKKNRRRSRQDVLNCGQVCTTSLLLQSTTPAILYRPFSYNWMYTTTLQLWTVSFSVRYRSPLYYD